MGHPVYKCWSVGHFNDLHEEAGILCALVNPCHIRQKCLQNTVCILYLLISASPTPYIMNWQLNLLVAFVQRNKIGCCSLGTNPTVLRKFFSHSGHYSEREG